MRPRAARPRLTLEALECRTTPSAGDLDLTFSDDGAQVLNLTPGVPDQAQGVVIQPDGKIVVAGAARSTLTDTVGVLIRLNADGSLDETFDGDGIAWLDLPGYDAEVFRAVALQADGKIVVTGDTAWGGPSLVTRFHTDGSLDTTFGTDGVALTSMISFAVAIQGDGKVVIAGSHYDGGSTLTFSFAAARFNADGTPDEAFGVNGMTLALTGDAGALDVLVQPDGKILMGGRSGHGYGPFALVRLNPDGGFDTTFDGDGVVTTGSGFVEENAGIRGLALDADGKIVATGVAQDWAIVVASVLRYNPDGSLDTTFGDDGRVYTTVPGAGTFAGEDVAVQADGKIVVIGGVGFPGDGRSTVSRYNPDGTLDETFTAAEGVLAPGIIETNLVPNDNDGYFGVVIQADGKIVAVGQVGGGSEQNFSVVRYEGTPVPHEPTLAPITPTIGPNGFTFTAEGSDPDAGDVLTYSLIGAPDGAVIDAATGVFIWTPGPEQLGQFTFTVRVTDAAGLIAEQSVTLTTLGVVEGGLFYVGTAGRDAMIFEAGAGGAVAVYRDGTRVGTFSGVSRIVAHGLGGNDILLAVGALPVEFRGGAGNDSLTGGVAADMLFGGQGSDLILGGAGNDRLRGGGGADAVLGGRGNDLLAGDAGFDMLIDTTGKDQYVGAAGDFLVDDSATINPTATVLERILVRRIWEAAGGRRVRP